MLLAFVALVHLPSLGAFFAADDFVWLTHRRWADAGAAFAGSWGLGTAYRPLARLDLVLDARMFGMAAWAWHAESIALQAVAAGLVMAVALQAGLRWGEAATASLLFAAMPLAWENVDWISGRTGLLMVVLGLLSTLCWLKALHGTAAWLWPAALALAAAMLCYEPAAVLPLALLAASPALRAPARRVLAGVAALIFVVAAVWMLRSVILGTAAVMPEVARASFWPGMARNLAGIILHGWRDFGPVAFCIVGGTIALGLLAARTRRAVACLLAAGFVLYAPFWTIDGVTERFFYACGVPLAMALVVASRTWPALRPGLAVLLVLFAWHSHAQAQGVAAAGRLDRAMLAQIAALPLDGRALVFDAVPTHLGPYYLLWGGFEIAASVVRPASYIAVRSETVLADPSLLRRVLAGPTHFLVFDGARGGFADMTRAAWLGRHPAAQAPWPVRTLSP